MILTRLMMLLQMTVIAVLRVMHIDVITDS